jgi:hypothetical protein
VVKRHENYSGSTSSAMHNLRLRAKPGASGHGIGAARALNLTGLVCPLQQVPAVSGLAVSLTHANWS